jgi:hypothetical protein
MSLHNKREPLLHLRRLTANAARWLFLLNKRSRVRGKCLPKSPRYAIKGLLSVQSRRARHEGQ